MLLVYLMRNSYIYTKQVIYFCDILNTNNVINIKGLYMYNYF